MMDDNSSVVSLTTAAPKPATPTPEQTASPAPVVQGTATAALSDEPVAGDMDQQRPSTPKDASAHSTFRGPGGSPILERTSPGLSHRPYQQQQQASADRRESSVSPTLTRQENNQNPLRMLPPPSPPSQRHQGSYTGMDLPPLSSLTTGLPHRPPSSGGMSISGMLGASNSGILGSNNPSSDIMHPHHHHHAQSHHHHHRPGRPYTPEYGNPLAPTSSTANSNPLAPRSQSTPTTPALGYPDNDSGHGRSNSYGRLPSNAGVLPTPFRDSPYRGYMSRDPPPHQREQRDQRDPRDQREQREQREDFPRPREIEQPTSPQQHPQDLQKQTPQYLQGKHSALNTGIPPPPPAPHNQPPRPVTNGSNTSNPRHHHHHHRPPPPPVNPPRLQPPSTQSRPPPKLHINNTPALDAVSHISPKPFLGRFIYEPGWILPATQTENNLGARFEVRIAQRFLNRDNECVNRRQLWGTGVYTDDSDIVAVLFHTATLPPPPLSRPKDIAAHFLILPTLQHYAPSTLNELRSRGWKVHDGYSIFLERIEWLPLGSAEGVWRGCKRRLEEELRMEIDEDEVGVVATDEGNMGGFRGVNWRVELQTRKRRNR